MRWLLCLLGWHSWTGWTHTFSRNQGSRRTTRCALIRWRRCCDCRKDHQQVRHGRYHNGKFRGSVWKDSPDKIPAKEPF